MSNRHKPRELWVLVVTATLTGACLADNSQNPENRAVDTKPAAPVPVATLPAGTPVDATPEQIADALMTHQRYQAAIEQYKKAPHSADVWNKTGVAYQLMLNLDDAARCYEQALKLDGHNAIVMNNLGTVYVTMKQYSRAERAYRKALKVDPRSALVHKNLGTALLAQHKYSKGWQEYQEALAIDSHIFQSTNSVRVENPGSVQDRGAMNYYMAKGCVRAGQADRAIEYLRMAINEGFISPRKVAADQEFSALRDLPAFQQLLAAERAQ